MTLSMPPSGTRVGCVVAGCEFHGRSLTLLGYGVLKCMSVPGDEAVSTLAIESRTQKWLAPEIHLDDGNRLWGGAECEWGEEDRVKADVVEVLRSGGGVVEMSIADLRTERLAAMRQRAN